MIEKHSAPNYWRVQRASYLNVSYVVPSTGLEPARPYGHRPSTCRVYHSTTRANNRAISLPGERITHAHQYTPWRRLLSIFVYDPFPLSLKEGGGQGVGATPSLSASPSCW